MVEVIFDEKFKNLFSKIKENPEIGKPMRFSRKGTREIYISPFRLSYLYDYAKQVVYILDLYHKDKQ